MSHGKVSCKKKFLNLGPKMTYFGIFGLEFENNFVLFEISPLEFIYLPYFGLFWDEILEKFHHM